MADPIHGVNPGGPIDPASAAQAGSPKLPNSLASHPAVDSADVGKTEGLLQTMAQAVATVPVVDQAKVSGTRDAIATGALKPDAVRIAQGIMEWESLLSGKTQP